MIKKQTLDVKKITRLHKSFPNYLKYLHNLYVQNVSTNTHIHISSYLHINTTPHIFMYVHGYALTYDLQDKLLRELFYVYLYLLCGLNI